MKLPMFRLAACLVLLALFSAAPAFSDSRTRSVSGVVTDRRGNALKGAAVQIENSANLSIASYITRDDGRYFFHGLNRDIDFTLTAKYKRWWSKPKLLNKFNSKDPAEVDLEIPVE